MANCEFRVGPKSIIETPKGRITDISISYKNGVLQGNCAILQQMREEGLTEAWTCIFPSLSTESCPIAQYGKGGLREIQDNTPKLDSPADN